MPFCDVEGYVEQDATGNSSHESVRLFYQLYGHADTKVLLITGVAATHDSWGPQLVGLCGTDVPNDQEERKTAIPVRDGDGDHAEDNMSASGRNSIGDGNTQTEETATSGYGVQVCTFDNRGVGRSSKPRHKHKYTTTVMARDALALMDHLGWQKVHVAGHSMGGMIACKLAAIAPDRIISLALISTTGGGYECLPKLNKKMFSIAYRFIRAKTPEERAHVDLDTHYTQDYLNTVVGGEKRRAVLYKEYVRNLSASGMQPRHGLDGQFNACWTHHVASHEIEKIRSSGIIVGVIHGSGDVVAQIRHARNLARKLRPVARVVELPGGHMVTHQNTFEVNEALLDLIKAERLNVRLSECSDEASYFEESWKIWQSGDLADTRSKDKEEKCGCVAAAVEMISSLWPHWLSFMYVFPTVYWPITWARSYYKIYLP